MINLQFSIMKSMLNLHFITVQKLQRRLFKVNYRMGIIVMKIMAVWCYKECGMKPDDDIYQSPNGQTFVIVELLLRLKMY